MHNPETLQISAFVDENPKGFGLMQRERDYAAFQDDVQHWERRPRLWIEPLGDWGPGAVQLIEIPSDSEVNENILAYWRPKAADGGRRRDAPSPTGSSGAGSRPSGRAVAASPAPAAGAGAASARRLFLVDFTGDGARRRAGDLADRSSRVGPGTIHRPHALPLSRAQDRAGRLRARSRRRERVRDAARPASAAASR